MNTQSHFVNAILSRFREMYRVTEGLQREKQSLMKQLDLLRYNKNIPWEHNQTWAVVGFNLFGLWLSPNWHSLQIWL